MNNVRSALLLLLLPIIGSCCSLHGMRERESTRMPDTISLQNNTLNKLDITYTTLNEKPTPLTLEVKQEVILEEPLSSLKELYVTPYGQVRGWFSFTALTGGYIKGTNVAALDKVRRAQQKNKSIRISIKPGGESVEATLGKGYLSDIAAAVSSYSYDIEIIKKKRTGDFTMTTLFHQFPQLLSASEKAIPILPRYVLSVGEYADVPTIEAAYKRIRAHWEPKTTSGEGDEAKLAQKVIEFAGEAKKSLLSENNTFDKLASENYFYKVPEEESEAIEIDYAIAAKESERVLQSMTSEERAAHRASMEEMGFVFDEPAEKNK